jgi:hypothetical protein
MHFTGEVRVAPYHLVEELRGRAVEKVGPGDPLLVLAAQHLGLEVVREAVEHVGPHLVHRHLQRQVLLQRLLQTRGERLPLRIGVQGAHLVVLQRRKSEEADGAEERAFGSFIGERTNQQCVDHVCFSPGC